MPISMHTPGDSGTVTLVSRESHWSFPVTDYVVAQEPNMQDGGLEHHVYMMLSEHGARFISQFNERVKRANEAAIRLRAIIELLVGQERVAVALGTAWVNEATALLGGLQQSQERLKMECEDFFHEFGGPVRFHEILDDWNDEVKELADEKAREAGKVKTAKGKPKAVSA